MKNLLIGAALAASLLLTACGGDTDGTATTSSTTTSSSAPATSESSTSTGTTSTGTTTRASETSSDGASSTVEPVTLDQQSITWFTALCGSTTKIQEASSAMGGMQPDPSSTPAQQQTLLAQGVTSFGTTFKTAATDIGAVPAPTIDGGAELASGAVTAYNEVGDKLIAASSTFAATPIADQAGLQTAAASLLTEIQSSVGAIQEAVKPLDAILTDELGAAVEQIPGCEGISGS